VLADKSEELAEAAEVTYERAVTSLRQPVNALGVAGALSLLVSAVLQPGTTLQFLGVLGLELTTLRYLLQFESPRAAAQGITGEEGLRVPPWLPGVSRA